jgi:uncharacterized damage-inducible protein DinB
MSRTQDLSDRLRELFLTGKWVANTNYQALLSEVSWLQARSVYSNLNSIAQLTYHVNYYLDGLLRAFDTGVLDISDRYSFDLPPIESEMDWELLRASLLANASRFAEKVASMEDSWLEAPFIDPRYGTVLRNLEGVLEHSYYHLGQIRLIKKLLD